MAFSEVDYLNSGGVSGVYRTVSVSAGQLVDVNDLGFEPSQILVTQTISSQNTYTSWTYLYDKDYSKTKMRFCGGNSSYNTWNDYNFTDVTSATSGFTEVNSNGFKFSNGSRDAFQRIDFIAIP